MSEPTTDEKIEQLVRSVLEAVDARLDAVRHEVAGFAADVEQRHHEILATVAALDERIDALRGQADDVTELQQEISRLGARVAALGQAGPTNGMPALTAPEPTAMPEPFHAEPFTVPGRHPAVTEVTGEIHIGQAELDAISKPLVTPHITTQVPMIPDPSMHHHDSVHHHDAAAHHDTVHHHDSAQVPLHVPPSVAPTFSDAEEHDTGEHNTGEHDTGEHDTGEDNVDDHIDLDQLASLLNERLGHFSLPGASD